MNTPIKLFLIIAGFIAAIMAVSTEAAEPTEEQYTKLLRYAQQCTAERDDANAAAIAIQSHVLLTCQKGDTFEARDAHGNVHKFYCSEVIEL